MKTQYIEGFALAGFATRTKNTDEMDPAKAKIGNLWQQFYGGAGAALLPESKVYGVYSNYESDASGEFDVTAAADTLAGQGLPGTEAVRIKAGNYLVFSGEGEMPDVVIALWGQIWQYFNESDCPHQRAYQSDFEYYKSESQVEIYIGISELS
ncbi:GyrI-like domain-containing protein [Thalassomonas haliotis]|uniref:Effector binding domain-containing protein n=1 Tax=Thalassomonas haliotis TaxID=485448 RepID=A0ABY7VHP2_9GAMM|nr:GyrI-like domain-containing protein [Thalassomonas haliotis]WDE12744.1 effector binding domain-containing protein [Thalassomonas haliotis]